MHILGLPDFTLDQIRVYIATKSDMLPVLAKIAIPSTFDNADAIEKHLKRAAVQLGYLRLCEQALQRQTEQVVASFKVDGDNLFLQDQRTALNQQKAYVLSLNEQITVETFEYFYFAYICKFPDDPAFEELTTALFQSKFKKNEHLNIPEANDRFAPFITLMREWIQAKGLQYLILSLSDNENYFSEFLTDAKPTAKLLTSRFDLKRKEQHKDEDSDNDCESAPKKGKTMGSVG
jgi:hypothetical protein